VLGILNSSLMNWYFKVSYNLVNIDPRYLKMAPMPQISASVPDVVKRQVEMVALVRQMLKMNSAIERPKTDQERIALQREVIATDTRIDALVYEVYGLTEEQVKIVEGTK